MASVSNPKDRRPSERVVLRMRITVIAEDTERKRQQFEAMTQVVNAHGGLMRTPTELYVGQSMLLENPQNTAEQACRPMAISPWPSSSPPPIPSFGLSFSHPRIGLRCRSEQACKTILARNSFPTAVFDRVVMVSARRTRS